MTIDEEAFRRSAKNAALSLAAAELAVARGNFNSAKVLRAVALAERITAVELARELLKDVETSATINELLSDVSAALPVTDSPRVARLQSARTAVQSVLASASRSLATNPDVLETDVHQFLWGCHLCGSVAEGRRPEACAVCGALGPDFELFAPFFAQSTERIGRLTPSQILEARSNAAARLAAEVAKLSEAEFERKPSPDEWSPREIVAHMIETDLLFAQRARAILADPPGELDGNVAPWTLHLGKGYEAMTCDELLERQAQTCAASLAIISGLPAKSWGRRANLRGAQATLADFGTWIANHDVGHTAQLRRAIKPSG